MPYKRIKLKKYSAGPAVKQALVTILSGTTINDINNEIISDKYVFGWEGNLNKDTTLTANTLIFSESFFDRRYSINHPNLVDNGYDLEVLPTSSKIIDMVQFGNFTFNLTNATTFGTRYALKTNPSGNLSYYLEPHEVVTYFPGTSSSEIEYYINNININITSERSLVYGTISGNNLVLYVPNVLTSGSIVYSLCADFDLSLPFNYLLEQPLNNQVKFSELDVVWGDVSGNNTFIYALSAVENVEGVDHPPVYSAIENEDDINLIYYNPFKCKNMYNYNWNTEVERPNTLYGCRDYFRVGKTQNQPWLCYKYYREDYKDIQEFELIERVRGLYKLVPYAGHKSNIYSIRITNSGLNEAITDEDIRKSIQKIVEKNILKAVRKIAPSYTQLWYIDWVGL